VNKEKFGYAKHLYKNRIHPRVIFGPEELSDMKMKIGSGIGKKILKGISEIARYCAKSFPENDSQLLEFMTGKDIGISGNLASCIYPIAVTAMLCDDKQLTLLLKRIFRAICMALDVEEKLIDMMKKNILHPNIISSLYPVYDWFFNEIPQEHKYGYQILIKKISNYVIKQKRKTYYLYSAHNIPILTTLSYIPAIASVYGDSTEISFEKEMEEFVKFFDASLYSAIHKNGYPVEDIGYGTNMLCFLGEIGQILFRAGFYNPYLCKNFLNSGNAILHFVQPHGKFLSNTGDHGDDINNRLPLLVELAHKTNDKSLLWLAGNLTYSRKLIGGLGGWNIPGLFDEIVYNNIHFPKNLYSILYLDELKMGIHPTKLRKTTSFVDPSRGIVSFRSSWDKDATLVIFDGSQRTGCARGHEHASCGHFSISSLEEYFAIDTGRFNMEQNCHNVVLINGRSGESTNGEWKSVNRQGVLIDYHFDDFVDFASVDSSHQHNAYWAKRYIALVKDNKMPSYVWLVEDINFNDDFAEFWWQLHTAYGNKINIISDRMATIKGYRKGNLMDIHFIIPDDWGYPERHKIKIEKDIAFPSSYKYLGFQPEEPTENKLEKMRNIAIKTFGNLYNMVHGPVYFRPRILAKVSGVNGRFMTLMIPHNQSQKPAITRLKTIPNSFGVKIDFGDVEDIIIFAYEHNILEAEDIVARGNWCVIRRDKKHKKIKKQIFYNGL
jgi:hypothetical protein